MNNNLQKRIAIIDFNFVRKKQFYTTKDPLTKIFFSFNDIEAFLKNEDKLNVVKYLFSSRETAHKILYNENEIIDLKFNNSKELSVHFYLNLLIKENPDIINYSYSIDYIKEANNERKTILYEYKNILIAKCINDLISNYKEIEEYNEYEDEGILNSIKEENIMIIKNGLNIFNIMGLDYNEKKLEKKKIDEIYLDIIIYLIKERKFNDYEYTYGLLNQLELISIDLTNKMVNELLDIINKKEKYINDYLILKIDDLFDEKKVNFYFILLKYILKNSIYFYQIPFFIETKKIILENIKKNKIRILNRNKNLIEKFEYIIKTLSDSEYYWNIYLNNKFKELREILNYYKEYYFESKKEDIKIIEEIIKNNENNFDIYLKDYELAKKMNLRIPLINYLYQEKNNGNNKTEESFKKEVIGYNKIEKMILDNKIKKINNVEKKILLNYFKNKKNKELLLKIFKENDYKFFINKEEQNLKKLDKNNVNENKGEDNKNNDKEKNTDTRSNNNNIDNKDVQISYKFNISQKQESISTKKSSKISSLVNKDNLEINKNIDLGAPFPSKKQNTKDIRNNEIIFNFVNNSKILFHFNDKKNIIYDNIYYGKYGIEIAFNKLLEYKEIYLENKENDEKIKNFMLLMDFLKAIEFEIKKSFLFNYYLKIKLEINREQINNNTDSSIYDISCIYTFYEPINNKQIKFRDENILINGINSNSLGFQFLLNNLNNPKYEKIEYKEINSKNQINERNSKEKNKKNIKKEDISENNNINNNKNIYEENKCNFLDESTRTKSILENPLFTKKSSEFNIIEFINIFSESDKAIEYINELSNSFYISGGCKNDLTLYDTEYNEKIRINDLNDWPFKVIEKKNNKKTKTITLLICTNQDFKLINVNSKTFKIDKQEYQIRNRTIINCIEMKENNMIIIGHGGASYYTDLFNQNNKLTEYKITDKTYRGGIKINDKTVVLTSNSIIQRGENKLLFYNIKSKRISNKIEGYSFTISNNNLALMPREEIITENKIILCACKRYTKEHKNGILLVNPNIGDCKRIENEFYDTYNFEVYCFCPILNVEYKYNNNLNINIEDFKKGIKITDTEYFFVGGFDLDKRIGIIKLFKIIYGEKIWKTKIKYIQDIEIEDNEKFEYFDGPISCINQSKTTGNISVACYNGKIYLFTPPNLNYYLRN